jgi:hypothetical protein
VKAFNHLRADLLATEPRSDGGRRVLFYSGDDAAAKAEVAALIERLGFAGIDLGSLAAGGNTSRRSARLVRVQGGLAEALDQHLRERADLAGRVLSRRPDHIYAQFGQRIARHHLYEGARG